MKQRRITIEYLPIIAFFLFGLSFMAKPIRDMDELWNYSFGSNIASGLYPYADFNMVQTPLSAYMSALTLAVFGDNLISFRILGAILFAIVFGLLYYVSKRIICNAALALTLTTFFAALASTLWMYNYNHLLLACVLALIQIEIVSCEKQESPSLLLSAIYGVIYGLAPLIKQSTGTFLILLNIVFCVFEIAKSQKIEKDIAIRILVSIIPSICYCIYLVVTNSFWDFLNYAVFGIKTFTHYSGWITYIFSSPIDFVVGIIPIIATAGSVYVIFKNKSRIGRKVHCNVLMICWAAAMVAYPICDYVHAYVAAVPFLVPLLCCFPNLNTTRKENYICLFIAIVVAGCSIGLIVKDLPQFTQSELNHYEGLPISTEVEQQIQEVNTYILEKNHSGIEVIIADEDAAAYMIPMDKYYKDFNLLLAGNVGKKTEEDLLWRDDVIYLVTNNNETLSNQAHTGLITYIKTNYSKVGEVMGFDAYAP